jgi:hypothetical protein
VCVAKLKVLITENGAKFENGISSTCTHLVIPDIVISANDKGSISFTSNLVKISVKRERNVLTKSGLQLMLHWQRKGDESEEPIPNTIKKPRARSQKTDAKAKSPVDQDVLMDEPAAKKGSIEAESKSEPETAIDTKETPTKETDSGNAQFSARPGESPITLAKTKNIPVAPWCEERCINSTLQAYKTKQ